MTATRRAIDWTEQGLVPDTVIRHGIRRLLKARLQSLPDDPQAQADARAAFIRDMDAQVIAPSPDKPNEQHYELPAEFFAGVLGAQRKYSCGYWPEGVNDLDRAEEAALHITGERAGLADGMDILELGCGWGSLTLWMARHFPCSRIVAVSNSAPQRRFIEAQAERDRLTNVAIITCDMNRFDTPARFDRVVSVEMFEHMRNYRLLIQRIAGFPMPSSTRVPVTG
jgi:cyclopropane-fatty-acyl-phospholipid synthase